ncbi:O-antigen ligase family protein [Candidatus Roizmanbacteria bacterium]|nr:O-antigen ligase family protein [Candidatus Roizmanbacteria bacterium]
MFLIAITIGVSVGVYKYGVVFGILIIAAIIGGPIVFSSLLNIRIGVYLTITIAYIIGLLLMLLPDVKIGLVQDVLIFLMVVGLLYRSYESDNWDGFKTPINSVVVLWIIYNLVEVANPIASSRVAWFYVARPAVAYILLFYVTYTMLETKNDIKGILNLLVGLTAFSALWGLIQFFNGYFPFEMNYVISHDAVHLVFISGRWRSFGTMASPAQYGIMMANLTVLIPLLVKGNGSRIRKLLYMLTAVLALLAMVYSGTRSAMVVIPIALMVLVLLAKNWRLYLMAVVVGMVFVGVMFMPTDNYHIRRLQTTFNGEKDESYMVRKRNREMITPWIMAHPMGGGLGSTGVWGQKFSPGTFLASFPPDSGFIRVAVELGWIGFSFYLILWVSILLKSVIAYLRVKDEELKSVTLAIICMFVGVFVVESAQDVVGKIPFNLLFWVFTAILFKAIKIDANAQSDTIGETEKHLAQAAQ